LAVSDAVFRRDRRLFGRVPHVSKPYVCSLCLGPATPGFRVCIGCSKLLASAEVPAALTAKVVPMTVAPSISEWYRFLVNYKRGHPNLWLTLVALAAKFLEIHAERIEELLGGRYDLVTPVPSKRGISYALQPLQRVLRGIKAVEGTVAHILDYRSGGQLGRWQYDPGAFDAGPASCRSRRVVLVEDTWVTGATALSAAGALLDRGATSVAVLPLARCIDEEFWSSRAPEYLEAMRAPFDIEAWPR